jgi:hypothetical protein
VADFVVQTSADKGASRTKAPAAMPVWREGARSVLGCARPDAARRPFGRLSRVPRMRASHVTCPQPAGGEFASESGRSGQSGQQAILVVGSRSSTIASSGSAFSRAAAAPWAASGGSIYP